MRVLAEANRLFENLNETQKSPAFSWLACQLLPRSKVLKPEPSAATMSATSALAADTLTRSAVVGDFIRSHRVPSVVSRIVPYVRPPSTRYLTLPGQPANRTARRYSASASSFDRSSGRSFPSLQAPSKSNGLPMRPVRNAPLVMKQSACSRSDGRPCRSERSSRLVGIRASDIDSPLTPIRRLA